MNQRLEYSSIIEEILFWVLRFEFPEQLVTFLLGLLPDDLYKVFFFSKTKHGIVFIQGNFTFYATKTTISSLNKKDHNNYFNNTVP